MTELAAFVAAVLLLALPGVLAVAAVVPGLSAGERWSLGATTGIGAAVVLAVVVGHATLALFYPLWALASVAAAIAWLRRRRQRPLGVRPDAIDCWLVLVLLSVAVTRFCVTMQHVLPPGGDPAFHLLLARKIELAQGMIFDWTPFETVALNYPIGSHILVVVLSRVAGVPLHDAFRLLCPMLGVVGTALVFHFAARVSRNRELALYAALAFGLWADYGSIGYYGWGGLPNQLGMCLLLALLTLLTEPRPSSGARAVMSVLLAGILVSHHHVMLVSAAVLGVLFLFFWLRRPEERRHVALAQVAIGAALLASVYIIPYARKSTTLGSTWVFRFDEVFFDGPTIIASLGWAFAVSVLIGVLLSLADRRRRFDPVLPGATLVLAALFVGFEYGYRFFARRWFGHDYVAFTPSRFLTDLTCFLAVYAGLALLSVRERLGRARWPVVVAALALSLTLLPRWRELAAPTLPDGMLEAGEWIRANTSPDTIVLNTDPWTSYLTWRRNLGTPLPVSEPLDQVVPRQREVQELIEGLRGRSSPEMKLIAISPAGQPAPGARVLWRHASGLAVVEIWPLAPDRAAPLVP